MTYADKALKDSKAGLNHGVLNPSLRVFSCKSRAKSASESSEVRGLHGTVVINPLEEPQYAGESAVEVCTYSFKSRHYTCYYPVLILNKHQYLLWQVPLDPSLLEGNRISGILEVAVTKINFDSEIPSDLESPCLQATRCLCLQRLTPSRCLDWSLQILTTNNRNPANYELRNDKEKRKRSGLRSEFYQRHGFAWHGSLEFNRALQPHSKIWTFSLQSTRFLNYMYIFTYYYI